MPRIVLLALLATLVASPALAQTGNGAPNGPHYNLNIIGIDPEKAKKVDMTDSNRHTIFVKLGVRKQDGTGAVETKIYLGASDDFVVCDGNGFDEAHDCTGTLVSQSLYGAVFGLPCNTNLSDPDGAGPGTLVPCDVNETAAYQVWARALGSPKGNPQSTTTTCATDPSDNSLVCSTEHMVLVRERGTRSVFKEYTNELTSILADIDGDGIADRVSLFAGGLVDWYWNYVNEGVRLAQIRFYWVSI
jgi:hypothetical protein